MMSQDRRRTLSFLSRTSKRRLRRPGWKNLQPRLEGLEDRTLLASADLVVTKVGPANVTAGTVATYTITLHNNGPDAAQNVQLSDTLSPGLSLDSVTFPPTFTNSSTATGFTSTKSSVASGEDDTFFIQATVFSSDAASSSVSDTATATSTTPDPNANNNSATSTSNVQTSADLSLVQSGPTTGIAGTTITYFLSATNNGPSDAQDYNLSDTMNGDASLGNFVLVSGPPAGGVLPAGQTAVFTLTATIPANETAGSVLHNTGTVFSATSDPNPNNNNSGTINTTVTTSADLVVTKTGPATVAAGTNITYSITVHNNGPSDAQAYNVPDTPPGSVSLVSYTQTSGPSVNGPLPAGATATFALVAAVPANLPPGTVLTNSVTATSSTSDPNNGNNTATVDTTVIVSADLAVTKAASPNPVLLGSNITYTINVANNGPSDAQNVALTDPLPAGTVFLSESQSSGPAFTLGHPNVGVNGVISNTIATLAAGASASFQIVVQAQSRALAQTTVVNTATIASTTTDLNTGNNSSTTNTQVFDQADLALTKVGPASVISGNNITYTLTLTNNGPIFDPNVVLTDAIPANTTFVSETQTSGPAFSCSTPVFGGTGTITCSIASLAAGASASFVIVVHVSPLTPNHNDIVNTARVSGNLFDPNTANNTATTHTTAITPTADLALTGTVVPTTLKGGGSGPIVYVFTVTNLGPDPSVAVVLDEALPSQVAFAGETHPASWTAFDPPLGSHNDVLFTIGSLAPGASATFTIVAKAPPLPAGTRLIDTAALTSATFDPVIPNNVVVIITPVQ